MKNLLTLILLLFVFIGISNAQTEVTAVQYQIEVFDSNFVFLRNIENTYPIDSTVTVQVKNTFNALKTLVGIKYNVTFTDSTYGSYLQIEDRPAFGTVARWIQIKNVRIIGR